MKELISRICLVICLVLTPLMLCGCSDKPFVLFSAQNPKEGLNREQLSVLFRKEEPIYYAVISPKGFKDGAIKISLTKKDTKTEFLGYTNYHNKTVKVGSDKYYSDYYVLREDGIYVMQVFSLRNLSKPIATGSFRVYDD